MLFFFRPYLYLDNEKIAAANLDQGMVEQAVAAALTDSKGIGLAVASSTLTRSHTFQQIHITV